MTVSRFLGGLRKAVAEPLEQSRFTETWSVEVTPKTAAKFDTFKSFIPAGTRIYIAHIAGTPIENMVATAKRLRQEGFAVMPHFPARSIPDLTTLAEWIARYRNDADVTEALLLGGGERQPRGHLSSSIDLLKSGYFDKNGFKRLHVAGHPEGNKDIDPDGSSRNLDAALSWKQDFSSLTDANMAIVTQFAFDAAIITRWAERIEDQGIRLPIHVGIAGPAKLQTLIQFALSCGVGPSMRILQKRAMDVAKLLSPYEPTEMISELTRYVDANPSTLISQLHIFPLGGIKNAVDWMNTNITVGEDKDTA